VASDATDLALPVFSSSPVDELVARNAPTPRKQDRSDECPGSAASTARPKSINRGHRHVNRPRPVRDDTFGLTLRQQSPFGATELGGGKPYPLAIGECGDRGCREIESVGPCARPVAEAAIVRRTTRGVMVCTRDLLVRGMQ
jgi:hypothetical protein